MSARAPIVFSALLVGGCGLVSGLDSLVVDGGATASDASDAAPDDVAADQSSQDVLATLDATANDAGSALSSPSACSSIAGSSPLSLSSSAFTIELWLQIKAQIQDPQQVAPILWNGGRAISEPGWTLALTSQGLEFCVSDSSAAKCAPPYALPTGDLLHIGVLSSISSQRTVQIFQRDVTKKDGAHLMQTELLNGVVDWPLTSPFTVGGARATSSCASASSFVVDDLRIYDTVLTPSQLDSDMGTIACNTQGLLAYFKFDEGAGLIAQDCSSAKLVLTLGSNATFVTSPFP